MAYNKIKVKERQVVPHSTQEQQLGVVSEVPMNEWNAAIPYEKLNLVTYKNSTFIAKRASQGIAPLDTNGWREVWMPLLSGLGISSVVTEYAVGDTKISEPPKSGWGSSIPTLKAGQYIWVRVTITYVDGQQTVFYTVGAGGVPLKTSDLTNDGDGTSPFATEKQLATETDRATKAEQANSNAITAETTRATQEEGALGERITQAVSELSASIGEETKRAEGAESGLDTRVKAIEGKIPTQASTTNQLADKAFVNSSINALAAFFITPTATGDKAWTSRAALLSAKTFYSGGKTRVPTQNDYAIVLADESQAKGVDGTYPTTRYSYQGGTYPNGQWEFQYIVNNTSLTQAQVEALNSGINVDLVGQITTNKNDIAAIKTKNTSQDTAISTAQSTADTANNAVATERTRAEAAEKKNADAITDLQTNKANVSDLNSYLPLTGGAMRGNIGLKNHTLYIAFNEKESDDYAAFGVDAERGLSIGSNAFNLKLKGKQERPLYISQGTLEPQPTEKELALLDDVNVKYTRPSGGIPKTDLASAVQSSLDKANSALQSIKDTQSGSGNAVTAVTASGGTVTVTKGETFAKQSDLTALGTRVTAVENTNTTQGTDISGLKTRLTAVENKNTSQDTAISTAQSTANSAKTTAEAAIPLSQKGSKGGVATLGNNGFVPYTQLDALPTGLDSEKVLEYILEDRGLLTVGTLYSYLADYQDAISELAAGKNNMGFMTPAQVNKLDSAILDVNAVETRVTTIEGKIPNQASATNQLADKAFVNSTVQTNTANFRGNWKTWAEVPTEINSYPADYAGSKTPTVNDYLVVQDASGYNSANTGTWRFKYSGVWATKGKSGWSPEYQVNETPLTTAQLAALNSGATSALVGQITTNKNDIAAIKTKNTSQDTAIDKAQSTADGKYTKPSGGIPKTDLNSSVQASLNKADNAVLLTGKQTIAGQKTFQVEYENPLTIERRNTANQISTTEFNGSEIKITDSELGGVTTTYRADKIILNDGSVIEFPYDSPGDVSTSISTFATRGWVNDKLKDKATTSALNTVKSTADSAVQTVSASNGVSASKSGTTVTIKGTNVTQSANGVMLATDKKKLDAFGEASTYATSTALNAVKTTADSAMPKSGGQFTGGISVSGGGSINTSGYVTGTWLATTNATDLGTKPEKIAVIGTQGSAKNYIYYRTPAEILSDIGAGTYTKPSGGIPASDLAGSIPTTKISGLGSLATKSTITSADITDGTISKTNLATAVQTSLGKADSALQSVPQATSTTLGGIKLGSATTQTVAANTASSTSGRTYPVQVNSTGQAVVNVPWTSGGTYTLPQATSTTLGGIKLGSSTTQTASVNTATSTSGRTYPVQVNSTGQAVVNVPWTDNDTKYTLPTATQNTLGGVKTYFFNAFNHGQICIEGSDWSGTKVGRIHNIYIEYGEIYPSGMGAKSANFLSTFDVSPLVFIQCISGGSPNGDYMQALKVTDITTTGFTYNVQYSENSSVGYLAIGYRSISGLS